MEIQLTERGPNGWAAAIVGGLIALAGILIAAALWSLANWLGIAILAVGIGEGTRRVCIGLAIVIRHHHAGRADLIRAQGDAMAQLTAAQAHHPHVGATPRGRPLPRGHHQLEDGQ